MSCFVSLLGAILLIFQLLSLASADVKVGDECGVDGRDFLDDTFTGEYRVSGEPGCSFGDESECFCAPDYGSPQPVGPWVWGCNSVNASEVPFGPGAGKVCPASIPVPVGYNEATNPPCDNTNPTGQQGDPPCVYNDCDSGGNFSAVCGCVDLSFGVGEDEENDLQWFCLHATCHCPPQPTSSSVTIASGMLVIVLAASAAVMETMMTMIV